MSEHNYKYTSENFSLEEAGNYFLLTQVNAESFSYAVTDGKNLLAWVDNCPLDELKNPQELNDILTAGYKQVITGLGASGFTLIPQTLFDNAYVANMARMLDVNDTDKIYAQPLDSNNAVIYKVDKAITGALGTFTNEEVVHRAKGWIAAVAGNYPTSTDLYINVENGTAEFLSFTYNKLGFYNSFAYKNHEELAYFVAFVAEELKMAPADVSLVLSGDINTTDRSFTYLAEFFDKVRLNDTQVITVPEQVQSHKILSLAALQLCAL